MRTWVTPVMHKHDDVGDNDINLSAAQRRQQLRQQVSHVDSVSCFSHLDVRRPPPREIRLQRNCLEMTVSPLRELSRNVCLVPLSECCRRHYSEFVKWLR